MEVGWNFWEKCKVFEGNEGGGLKSSADEQEYRNSSQLDVYFCKNEKHNNRLRATDFFFSII